MLHINKAILILFFTLLSIQQACSQVEFQFLKIPTGEYTLGQKKHPYNPEHTVNIDKEYFISNFEITNQQFKEFVDATSYTTDAEKLHNAMIFVPGLRAFEWLEDTTAQWRYPNGIERGGIENKMDHPVTCISFRDAQAYCKWAKVRLPTLDEWEIACRAGTATKIFFKKDTETINNYANIWNGKNHLHNDTIDNYTYTSPVGSFSPNPWGLYDVYGNVFEFCKGKTPLAKKLNQVICARGGSWWCSYNTCNYFNSVDIGRISESVSFSNQGFRVAKDE